MSSPSTDVVAHELIDWVFLTACLGLDNRTNGCNSQKKRGSPSIDVVAHEQVIGVRALTTDAAELQEVLKLTMDIAAYCDGALHWLHIALVNLQTQVRTQRCLQIKAEAVWASYGHYRAGPAESALQVN